MVLVLFVSPGTSVSTSFFVREFGGFARLPNQDFVVVAGTMGQLCNVPGDNHCFYHALACGMLDRQAQFDDMPVSQFWKEIGAHPALLRCGMIAFQRSMASDPRATSLRQAWAFLTLPGEDVTDAACRERLLAQIEKSEVRHSWMGECTGDYSLMSELLNIVVKVFHPPGCQLDGSPLPSAAQDKEPSMQGDVLGAEVSLDNGDVINAEGSNDGPVLFLAGGRCDAVLRGDPSRYRGIVSPGLRVEGLHVRNTYVPIHYVVQALQAADHQAIDKQMRYAWVLHKSRLLAKQNECAVFHVHDGDKHFMYPHIYYHLLTDYKSDSLSAFAVA